MSQDDLKERAPIDGEPDSSNNTANSTTAGSPGGRKRSLLTYGLIGVLLAAIGIALLVFVIGPRLQTDEDPLATGPDITVVKKDSATDSTEPDLRGSFTDLLFQPREQVAEHPLDPALEVARLGLERIRNEVRDYTALMVKQERIKDKLLPEEFLRVKVRHSSAEPPINRAFYVRHVKPKKMAGQEAIWVENENDGKLIAHGTGLEKLIPVPPLKPTGVIAMRNNRYPITELGIETLIIRMLEKGERDRQHDDGCTVEVSRDLQLDGNPCTLITITHPKQQDPFEFHIAKIYIDDKLQLPVGYEGYMWPKEPGGEPVLIERYFYREIKINVGLTDLDFDRDNPEYDY